MAIRMKDIASDLGLSVVTVSKVLRNHPDIGEETRERVLRRVKELDYQPNATARSLVTGRSYLIGLIVPDLLHPFFAEVAKAVATVLRSRGYYLIVSSSEEDPELEMREIRHLQARRLDAIIVASTGNSITQFQQMDDRDEIYMLIDRELPGLQANYVGIDDELAGRIATEHLIAMGCRRIAHIRGRANSTGNHRFEGYRKALEAHGIPFDETLVVSRNRVDTRSREHGAEAMRLLLEQTPALDGVFCYNDPLAIGAINTVLDAGLRIPDDIAIIGCGNLHYDEWLRVALSSIDQQSEQIGRLAAEMILTLVESKQKPEPRSTIVDPKLIARASTARSLASNSRS